MDSPRFVTVYVPTALVADIENFIARWGGTKSSFFRAAAEQRLAELKANLPSPSSDSPTLSPPNAPSPLNKLTAVKTS